MTDYVLPFEKMHGLGNDFVFLERRYLPPGIKDSDLAKILCNRNMAIGGDGLIVVDLSPTADADFKWDYYNGDGSIAEMCGNGMRCFAKYVFERGFTDETSFKVITEAGIIEPTINEDSSITVNIGPATLPDQKKKTLSVNGKDYEYTYIEVGNPHCIIFTNEKVSDEEFNASGPLIEQHSGFPNGVNVEFAYVKSDSEIDLRVWERGCGPTLACGTGACATLVAAAINGLTGNESVVNLPGGPLKIKWDRENNKVFLTGPATFVYTGHIHLNPKTLEANLC